ncbi:MAG: hypothetical protein GX893_01505 [Firmicutes bacterium]|nr:hypothetical protein [Bacillota bacterium]
MHDLNEAFNTLLRHYRHDFLNILQVISGLVQLQKTDKLLAYIPKASEEVYRFGRFIGCGDARLALIIFDILLQNIPGRYVLHVEKSLPLLAAETLQGLTPTLLAAKDCLLELKNFTVVVFLEGGAVPKLRLCPTGEKAVTWQPALQAARQNGLQAKINHEKGEFLLYLG